MGWARAQLAERLYDTSRNQAAMPRMPVIGDPEHPRLALYQHCILVGFASGVYIFPKTETVVLLLLSNAVAINDGPDWIGHLITPITYKECWKIKLDRGAENTAQKILWAIERHLLGDGMELTKEMLTGSKHQEL